MEDAKYVESSIAVSRNYQEQLNCLQGITGYGKFAHLLECNLGRLDSFAEYAALCVSESMTKNRYTEQYKENFEGFIKRNLGNPEEIHNNEKERRNLAFLSRLLTEAGLKYGIRGLKLLAETKEQTIFYGTVFSILKSYLEENDNFIFYEDGNRELKKILKSFPINSKTRQQIWESAAYDSYDKIETFGSKIDSNARYSLSYLLYAVHVQKYGKGFENTSLLKQYYSLIGYSDNIINEIIEEHSCNSLKAPIE